MRSLSKSPSNHSNAITLYLSLLAIISGTLNVEVDLKISALFNATE